MRFFARFSSSTAVCYSEYFNSISAAQAAAQDNLTNRGYEQALVYRVVDGRLQQLETHYRIEDKYGDGSTVHKSVHNKRGRVYSTRRA